MQNLSLPFIPVQEIFYLDSLQYTFSIFTTSSLGRQKFYIYRKGEGRKSSDEDKKQLLFSDCQQFSGFWTEMKT
jgi:hypothetical protein